MERTKRNATKKKTKGNHTNVILENQKMLQTPCIPKYVQEKNGNRYKSQEVIQNKGPTRKKESEKKREQRDKS